MSTAAPEDLIRRRRRKRPRRLRSVDLPSDLHPATLAGLYESASSEQQAVVSGGTSTSADGSGLTMSLLSTEWVERPLPPMSVLATVQTGRSGGGGSGSGGNAATAGPDCPPLLTDFLKSIGVGVGADGNNNDVQAKEGDALINKGHFDDGGKDETGSQNEGPTKSVEAASAAANTPPPASTTSVMPEIEPIDDPNRSTLTVGQHKRYLQLWTELRAPSSLGAGGSMNSSGKTTPKQVTPREREFRSLDRIARQEWAAYGQAMAEFRRRNADRFLLGFRDKEESTSSSSIGGGSSAYEFVQSAAAAKSKRSANQRDGLMAKVYGRCVQEVSLQDMAAVEMGSHGDGSTRRRRQASGAFDTKSHSAQIVHSTPSDRVARMNRDWLDKLSSPETTEPLHPLPISPESNSELSSPKSISHDDIAERLARENNVDVVMTAETFIELLRRPGLGDSRWMVPISKGAENDDRVVLEEPTPRRATSREYLTSAYEDSVYGSAWRSSPSQTNKESSDLLSFQSVYTVVSLPKSSPQDGPCKVLVRSTNKLLTDDEGQRPVHLDVHLEYFFDRGVIEQCPHHRRAMWLAHKLLQPDSLLLFVRVDPNSSRIVSVSEKSVAHALAGSDESMVSYAHQASGDARNLPHLPDFDAMSHFQAAAKVIRAATTCKFSGKGGGLLCLPGRGLSSVTTNTAVTVSVHQEADGKSTDENVANTVINLGNQVKEADAVFTGQEALMSCFIPWEWKGDLEASQIPFTFPLKKDNME